MVRARQHQARRRVPLDRVQVLPEQGEKLRGKVPGRAMIGYRRLHLLRESDLLSPEVVVPVRILAIKGAVGSYAPLKSRR
jgi:hypothetical protein